MACIADFTQADCRGSGDQVGDCVSDVVPLEAVSYRTCLHEIMGSKIAQDVHGHWRSFMSISTNRCYKVSRLPCSGYCGLFQGHSRPLQTEDSSQLCLLQLAEPFPS